jgi:anaerobic ribonucleoside-triphosphate reductase activating protein
MYYGNMKYNDIANGIGVRTSLFVSGCRHHCKGCFQPQTWDFDYGKPFTKEEEEQIAASLREDYVAGLTVLGGEPMEAENQEVLYPFLKRIRQEFPDKSIWIYTGYLWEELTAEGSESVEAQPAEGSAQSETHPAKGNPQKIFLEHRRYCRCRWTLPLLRLIDILVDGEFHEAEKDLSIRFRGSRNQRLIDVKESLARGEVVLSEFMYKEGE